MADGAGEGQAPRQAEPALNAGSLLQQFANDGNYVDTPHLENVSDFYLSVTSKLVAALYEYASKVSDEEFHVYERDQINEIRQKFHQEDRRHQTPSPSEKFVLQLIKLKGRIQRVWISEVGKHCETVAAVIVDHTLFVVFCGSHKQMDWFKNAFWGVKNDRDSALQFPHVQFHDGMYTCAEGILTQQCKGEDRDKPLVEVLKEFSIEEVVFTGHSKGGGVAQVTHMLTSAWMLEQHPKMFEELKETMDLVRKRTCLVYAAPMPFSVDMSELTEKERSLLLFFQKTTYNFVCTADVVVQLPGNVKWVESALPHLTRKAKSVVAKLESVPKLLKMLPVQKFIHKELNQEIGEIKKSKSQYRHLCTLVCLKVMMDDSMQKLNIRWVVVESNEQFIRDHIYDGTFGRAFEESHQLLPRYFDNMYDSFCVRDWIRKAAVEECKKRVWIIGGLGYGKSTALDALLYRDVSYEFMVQLQSEDSARKSATTKTKGKDCQSVTRSFDTYFQVDATIGNISYTDTPGLECEGDPKKKFRGLKKKLDGNVHMRHLLKALRKGECTHIILVIKKDARFLALSPQRQAMNTLLAVLKKEAWLNRVFIYVSGHEQFKSADSAYEDWKKCNKSDDIMQEILKLVPKNHIYCGTLVHAEEQNDDHRNFELRKKTLEALVKFVENAGAENDKIPVNEQIMAKEIGKLWMCSRKDMRSFEVCLCAYCGEEIEDDRKAEVLSPCNHFVHNKCASRVNEKCPKCSEKVETSYTLHNYHYKEQVKRDEKEIGKETKIYEKMCLGETLKRYMCQNEARITGEETPAELVEKGTCLFIGKHYEQAEKCFEKALKVPGKNDFFWTKARATNALGVILLRKEKFEDAAKKFKHASKMLPNFCCPPRNLGLVKLNQYLKDKKSPRAQEHLEEALDHYQKAMELEQRNKGPDYASMAKVCTYMENHEKAAEYTNLAKQWEFRPWRTCFCLAHDIQKSKDSVDSCYQVVRQKERLQKLKDSVETCSSE